MNVNASAVIHTRTRISDFSLTEQELKLIKICLYDSMTHYEQQLGDIMNNEEMDTEYKQGIIEGIQQIIPYIKHLKEVIIGDFRLN